MNLKILVIVALFFSILIGIYLMAGNTPKGGEMALPLETPGRYDKKSIGFESPIHWVNNKPFFETEEKIISQPKTFQNITSKIQDALGEIKIFENDTKEIVSKTEIEDIENYYTQFFNAINGASFTEEESSAIQKTDDNIAFSLEELIEKAVKGENLNELKKSFSFWQKLDERVLIELNKIAPAPKTFSFHQVMLKWFEYHSKIASRFSEENLSQDQIIELSQQFQREAEIHNLKFGKSLSKLKSLPGFVLIPTAQAFTCGALVPPPFYHFGGRVVGFVPCYLGIVVAITPPCGGLLYFSYPIMAANPFLWKKPTPGAAILGRAFVLPSICFLAGSCPTCVPIPYEAWVLYFGTSLTP